MAEALLYSVKIIPLGLALFRPLPFRYPPQIEAIPQAIGDIPYDEASNQKWRYLQLHAQASKRLLPRAGQASRPTRKTLHSLPGLEYREVGEPESDQTSLCSANRPALCPLLHQLDYAS